MSAIATEISAPMCEAEAAAARGDGKTVGKGVISARVPLVVQTPGGSVTLLTRDAQQAVLLRVRIEAWLAGSVDDFGDVPLAE